MPNLLRPAAWLLPAVALAACGPDTPAPGDARSDAAVPAESHVRLYIADRYDDVYRLDPGTLEILDTIDTPPRAHGLVASPDGRLLYVTVETSNELLKIDVATHEILGRAAVGPVPNEPTISADGRRVFVPQRAGARTDVVDTETMEVVASLDAGREEHNAYTSADGGTVFVTSMGDSLLTAIDPETLEVERRIHVGGIPRPVALTADLSTAYVALSGLHGFVTLDLVRGEVTGRTEIPVPEGTPPPALDTYTHGLLLTPDEDELWVASYGTDRVYAFTVPGLEPLADIQVAPGPHWFTLHPDGEPLYVTLERDGKVAAIHRGVRMVSRIADVSQGPTRILAFRAPGPG